EPHSSFTCDRREFLGRNGSPSSPAALKRVGLSGTSGAGLDPCGAFQSKFQLAPGEEKEVVMILGQTENLARAQELITYFRDSDKVEAAFQQVVSYWERSLTAIEIKTPDEAMNHLVNRW